MRWLRRREQPLVPDLGESVQRAILDWRDAQEHQLDSACSSCGAKSGLIDSLFARTDVLHQLAPKAAATLIEVTNGLPWVDATGRALPFQGVPHWGIHHPGAVESEDSLLAGLNEAVDHQYSDRTTYWTRGELIARLQQAEAIGYAQRTREGWNWPFLCPDCQYDKLRQSSSKVRPTSVREPVPPRIRFRVLQRDGFRCTYCGRSQQDGATLHVDHVVPVSDGGSSDDGNLVAACDECNLGKGSMRLP